MSVFDKDKHPRDRKGKFITKLDVPSVPTAATTPIPNVNNIYSTETNTETLEQQYLEYKENMKPHISIIADITELEKAIEENLIYRTQHPEYPYSIYKYSQACTYSSAWNEITIASRGLILHDETGEIIARPFPKFFNYSEGKTPEELMVGDIHVTEKMDGSLGISFINPQGDLEITTAGGFQAEQAAHATQIYNERYKGNWEPRKGYTYLWEIIYPENRIVVDYGDEDDIYLLGAVEIATGKSIPVDELTEWKWKKAQTYDGFNAMEKVVKAPDRSNAEGYIVLFKETGVRIKIKHEEYIRQHRYATGINSRRLWEMLAAGDDFTHMMQTMPEEFNDYVNKTRQKLTDDFNNNKQRILNAYEEFVKNLPQNADQKTFAIKVNEKIPKDDRGFFFTLRNNGHINDPKTQKILWERVKPEFTKSFWKDPDNV